MQPRVVVLFAVFVISVLVTVGLAIYAGGALFGVRERKVESFSVPPSLGYPLLATPPAPPRRVARGTTPPAFDALPRAPTPPPRYEEPRR